MSPHDRVPRHVLLAGSGLGPGMPAQRALETIAGGMREAGLPSPDMCALPAHAHRANLQTLLAEVGFDTRMRSARALIVVAEMLREDALAGSAAFELATRARQAGVPCYALVAENRLSAFDLRVMDLQVVLEARAARALAKAGRDLAALL